jgi:hypothetical protein
MIAPCGADRSPFSSVPWVIHEVFWLQPSEIGWTWLIRIVPSTRALSSTVIRLPISGGVGVMQ